MQETYTYQTYSWTEHICRKWGQPYFPDILMEQMEKRGFRLERKEGWLAAKNT